MTATRPYRLGRRAERQAQTRQRIVEAAVDLHSTVGPATTSISAIAERAGVQRHTVYAHFPDETLLFEACSSHWIDANPFPDVSECLCVVRPRRGRPCVVRPRRARLPVMGRGATRATLRARRPAREGPPSTKGSSRRGWACARVRDVALARAHPGVEQPRCGRRDGAAGRNALTDLLRRGRGGLRLPGTRSAARR